MIIDVIFCFLSEVVLLLAFLIRPDHARCPGWIVEGIRPNGSFYCHPKPVGATEPRDARGLLHDHSTMPPGELRGRIYCTGGQETIVVDFEKVGCQARH